MRRVFPCLGLAAALLAACATTSSTPDAPDPLRHAHVTVQGFREANPFVAERLASAAAWAVFPDVEETADRSVHPGWLLGSDVAPRPVRLRCDAGPLEPAGAAFHALVVLEDPRDVATLEAGTLDLSDAVHLSPHDRPAPEAASARRWVVTSERGGVLHGPRALRPTLELVDG